MTTHGGDSEWVPAWGNPSFAPDGAVLVTASFESYQGGVPAIDWETEYVPDDVDVEVPEAPVWVDEADLASFHARKKPGRPRKNP